MHFCRQQFCVGGRTSGCRVASAVSRLSLVLLLITPTNPKSWMRRYAGRGPLIRVSELKYLGADSHQVRSFDHREPAIAEW
jgi:hypothetical protein